MSESRITRGALWAWDLTAPRPDAGVALDGYAIIDAAEVAVADLARAGGESEDEVKRRLYRGSRPLVAASPAGEIVAGTWLSWGQEWAPPIRRTFHLAPDEVYAWDAWTSPAHGGRGLFTALLRCAGHGSAEAGCRVLWGAIHDANCASQRACARAGYRPVLHLMSQPEVIGYRFDAWPVVYADERLVERARRIVNGGGGR